MRPQTALLLVLTLCAGTVLAQKAPVKPESTEEITAFIDRTVQAGKTDARTSAWLVSWLENPASSIRVAERAAWALGRLNVRTASPALNKAAFHKSLLVRAAALDALMIMKARMGLPAYKNISQSDPVLALRVKAVLAMGLLRWSETVPTLVALATDPAPEVRGAVALAMAASQSSRNDFSEAVAFLAKDPSPYVQERAQMGLEVVQKDNKTIQKQFSSSDPAVRLFAALYFHYNGKESDLPAISSALKDDSDVLVSSELEDAAAGIKKRVAQEKARAAKKAAAESAAAKTKANSQNSKPK